MECRSRRWSLHRKPSQGRTCFVLFLIFIFFFLISCSNKSIFTGLDYPDTEEISRYSGERLLSSLEVNIESPAFYRALTEAQRERILSTLDTMMAQEKEVLVEGSYSLSLSRSAKAAVTILIYSSPLVYDIIYNFVNPALSALTLSGISMEELYVVYTDSIKYFLLRGIQGALEEIAFAFSNLYRISNYYNEAVEFAPFGVYSGGDLQNYLLSSILGGLIRSTQNFVAHAQQDYQEIAEAVSEIYYQLVNAGTVDSQLVESLFNLLSQKLQIPLEEILSGYKLELDFVAGIFEAMAKNAGYNLMAQDTARTIRSWGNEDED